jgi:hypothetical protein
MQGMRKKLAVAVVVVVAAMLVPAAVASAHNVYASPSYGDIYDPFYFVGTQWQGYQRTDWYYDRFADGRYEQAGSFRTPRNGRFTFRWNGEDTPGTHRMCFRQYDSRYGRTYFKCALFTALA